MPSWAVCRLFWVCHLCHLWRYPWRLLYHVPMENGWQMLKFLSLSLQASPAFICVCPPCNPPSGPVAFHKSPALEMLCEEHGVFLPFVKHIYSEMALLPLCLAFLWGGNDGVHPLMFWELHTGVRPALQKPSPLQEGCVLLGCPGWKEALYRTQGLLHVHSLESLRA